MAKSKEREKEQPQDDDTCITFRIPKDKRDALLESARRDNRVLSSLMRKLACDHLESELATSK